MLNVDIKSPAGLFSPAAVGDGITNDAPAFAAFNAWAISNQGSDQIVLNIPSGIYGFGISNNPWWTNGIKNLVVNGYGATLRNDVSGGQGFFLGSGGIGGNNLNSVRIETVDSGDSSITVKIQPTTTITNALSAPSTGFVRLTVDNTTGFSNGIRVRISGITGTTEANGGFQLVSVVDAIHLDLPEIIFRNNYINGGVVGDVTSLFSEGSYVLLTGGDLQGLWKTPYGDPPNPVFFEFLVISAIDLNTNIITFTTPIKNTYKSTWPNYNNGDSFHSDNAGPATLYAMGSGFDATLLFQGLTINNQYNQTVTNGKSITFQDCFCIDGFGIIPSQNINWAGYNVDMSNCTLELDKIVDTYTLNNCIAYEIDIQSSSTNLLSMSNTRIIHRLTGVPRKTLIQNCTIGDNTANDGLWIPCINYGLIDEIIIKDSNITKISQTGPSIEITNGNVWMSGPGLITTTNGNIVVGGSSNSAGKYRLTLETTNGLVDGGAYIINNVYKDVNNKSSVCGKQVISIIDSTNIDIPSVTFDGFVYGGSVGFTQGGGGLSIASPEGYVTFSNGQLITDIILIKDLTQDLISNTQTIVTDFTGSLFPVDTLGSTVKIISTVPKLTVVNCTGGIDVQSLSNSSPGSPWRSFFNVSYNGTLGTQGALGNELPFVVGYLSRLIINVIKPYTGILNNLDFKLSLYDNWNVLNKDERIISTFPPCLINTKIIGKRTMTPYGQFGVEIGDTFTTPGKVWFGSAPFSGPALSQDISEENISTWPIVELTLLTDQEIPGKLTMFENVI